MGSGLNSSLPPRLLPFVTLFLPENSHVGYPEARRLRTCGLPVEQLCVLRIERLVIHEVLVRVTSDLSVPDDPSYEYLGIQIRGMADQLSKSYDS